MNNVLFGGVDPRPGPLRGEAFAHYETLAGGAGGGPEGAGADAIQVHMTNTLNTSVESLERSYPVRITRYALRPQSPGQAAEHRGGAGVVRTYLFLAPVRLTLVTDRRVLPPWGLGGGTPGALGRNVRVGRDGRETHLPGRVSVDLEAGESLRIETPGGGGYRAP
jgi:N-methylhydantoinase B